MCSVSAIFSSPYVLREVILARIFITFSGLTLMIEHCFLMQNQCIE